MHKLHSLYLMCLSLGLLVPAYAGATSIVAADDGGYAGNVMEKVGNEWTPPPGLRGNFSVRIKVTVDEDGNVRSCKPTGASAIKALDDAACGAVYKAAPFGKTPDGKPVDVHMAFRIGTPKKAPREPTFEESATEILKERERLNNQIANEQASYTSTRAREQAEALAQKMGKELPDLHMPPLEVSKPVPVPSPMTRNNRDIANGTNKNTGQEQEKRAQATPPQKAKPEESAAVPLAGGREGKGPELVIKSNLKNLDATLEAQSEATAEAQVASVNTPVVIVTRQPAPSVPDKAATPPQTKTETAILTQEELDVPPLEKLKAEMTQPAAPGVRNAAPAPAQKQEDRRQAKVAAPVKTPAPSVAGNARAEVAADMGYVAYLDRLKQDIRTNIQLPPTLPKGRHVVSVQLFLSGRGRIKRADIIHHGSNVQQDRQLAQAVKRVDRVTPPPAALGRSFPLTLVFDVQ